MKVGTRRIQIIPVGVVGHSLQNIKPNPFETDVGPRVILSVIGCLLIWFKFGNSAFQLNVPMKS